MSVTKVPYKLFIAQYAAWWLGASALQTVILHQTAGIDWLLALQDGLITNVVLALVGIELIIVMRHYQPRQSLRFVWSVVIAGASTAFIQWLLGKVIDDAAYIAFVDRWIIVRGVIAWLLVSFITVASWMWFYMNEQQEIQMRNADTEKLARETELTMLRQQLQPHFLFNSLNSISALAGSKPEEARRMIQQLSDFLRGTIRRNDQSMITLDEELAHLQLYLDIEKVRFGHRLKTVVEKAEGASSMKLPALMLQPLVENAIKFGLYDTIGEITISIRAVSDGTFLKVTVENPFDPATAPPKKGTGFGISSIQRRLYLLFGRNDLLTTKQTGAVFTTEVRIPQS
ncbi:MAG TPA: histidine kinase [Ohtaekwangia sp.]|nr:histidine kinase [Ohtaekwangia sp.]